jgi:hypothetical protein
MMMRTMIFGPYAAAVNYAREKSLSPGNWCHGTSRARVMGLNTNEFHTVIVGDKLDAAATEALREWNLRRRMYNSGDEGNTYAG